MSEPLLSPELFEKVLSSREGSTWFSALEERARASGLEPPEAEAAAKGEMRSRLTSLLEGLAAKYQDAKLGALGQIIELQQRASAFIDDALASNRPPDPEAFQDVLRRMDAAFDDLEKGVEEVRPASAGPPEPPDGPASKPPVSEEPVKNEPVSGETASTRVGKRVHKANADARRASGDWDEVNTPMKTADGEKIQVAKRVNLKTGEPMGEDTQVAQPDAVSYKRGEILDDKPAGRPIAKDRQEMIRNIEAYRQRTGHLPEKVTIVRYDPKTGAHVSTETYKPEFLLP